MITIHQEAWHSHASSPSRLITTAYSTRILTFCSVITINQKHKRRHTRSSSLFITINQEHKRRHARSSSLSITTNQEHKRRHARSSSLFITINQEHKRRHARSPLLFITLHHSSSLFITSAPIACRIQHDQSESSRRHTRSSSLSITFHHERTDRPPYVQPPLHTRSLSTAQTQDIVRPPALLPARGGGGAE